VLLHALAVVLLATTVAVLFFMPGSDDLSQDPFEQDTSIALDTVNENAADNQIVLQQNYETNAGTSGSAAAVTPQGKQRWLQRREGLDPTSDGWSSEVFSQSANSQLKILGKFLTHPEQVDDSHAQRILDLDFTCDLLRPLQLQTVFRSSVLQVDRGVIDEGSSDKLPPGQLQGQAGLVEAARSLTEPLRDATDVRIKFKSTDVERRAETVVTRQLVTLSGRTSDGMFELNATWRIHWRATIDNEPPRITWIGVQQYEQVTTHTDDGPLFADCTQSVLGADTSFSEQMCFGINHWAEQIEECNDLVFFEHNGLAVGDANGDGLDDVYVCQQGGLPNRLYVQQIDGTVKDVSADAGVDLLDLTYSALLVDVNNDAVQDLVVSTSYHLLMFAGDGRGRFDPVARISPGRGFSISAADYDLDGDLDIYSALYYAHRRDASALPVPVPYYDANNGGENYLLRNDGNWKFTNVTESSGLNENNSRFSFAASWEDFDNDGDSDLYVANDYGRNNLYRNDRGKFTDIANQAGVQDGAFGMSVSWSDYNHDGWMDVYIANMFSAAGNRVAYQREFGPRSSSAARTQLQYLAKGNTLFANRGDGTFRDVSTDAGVTMGRWGWASLFADINNDTWDDLVLANGYYTGTRPDDL